MIDPESNLIIRWLGSLSDCERAALSARFLKRIEYQAATGRTRKRGDDPAHTLGTMLFVDCAAGLGLSPQELRGLLCSPKRHVMRSVTWLALEQIRTMSHQGMSDTAGTFATNHGEPWGQLPDRIVRRMNDTTF